MADAQVLEARTVDAEGRARPLRELIASRRALLVFLRHFGCVGCSRQVDALVPVLSELHELGIETILIGNGEPRFIPEFIERHRLAGYPVTIVTDPSLGAHRAAGFERSAWATIGPRALWEDIVAMGKGYFGQGRKGDILQQGGLLLLDQDHRVVQRWSNRSAPEPIAAAEIVEAVIRLGGSSANAEQRGVV